MANTISGIAFGTDTALVLAWLGFLTSWTYLRFYKKQPDLSSASTGGNEIRGDASETFAFAYFWPDAIQPPIAAVADSVVGLFGALSTLFRMFLDLLLRDVSCKVALESGSADSEFHYSITRL